MEIEKIKSYVVAHNYAKPIISTRKRDSSNFDIESRLKESCLETLIYYS